MRKQRVARSAKEAKPTPEQANPDLPAASAPPVVEVDPEEKESVPPAQQSPEPSPLLTGSQSQKEVLGETPPPPKEACWKFQGLKVSMFFFSRVRP